MTRRRFSANTVRSVGSLLPSDVLGKAQALEGLEGLDVEDFGHDADERLRDVVTDAWNEARGLWWRFQSELRDLDRADETATSLTRERWLLPLLGILGFDDIETVRGSVTVGEVEYPISHVWGSSPLHLMGARVGLDDRIAGVRGAARLSPHSLTQQFLNRSDDHLWGIVSNGTRLRILRDSVSLTRQAYVEFDLEAMFNGEVFPDFALLFVVAHSTRFTADDRPEECLLEGWIAAARDDGIRALDQLRDGVESALVAFGTGFIQHADNSRLRQLIESGDVAEGDLYRHLLRVVYRLLFLFIAEDRDLLLVPEAPPEARDRYDRYYSTGRVRDLASRSTAPGHQDLWKGLTALFAVLGQDDGEPELGLPGLGSFLWAEDSIGNLSVSSIDNAFLLDAIRGLAYVDVEGMIRRIDFASLGAEELGSVYESLLELHPTVDLDTREFSLGGGAGSERKTTGSYYTPTELISELLDSALDPVLDRAANSEDPEQAILDLKVVDPAAGSGHFLVAAAHRIGKRLAEVRTGEPEPPNRAYREAVRDVVSRCIYAVDLNDLAVELCKVSLWIETLEPGRPLSFLDHHILGGNSLLGATPGSMATGIPDKAFRPLPGDDEAVAAALKKRNRAERDGQESLALGVGRDAVESPGFEVISEIDEVDLAAVKSKEHLVAEWRASRAHRHALLEADAWCAAFMLEKVEGAPALTHRTFERFRETGEMAPELEAEIRRIAREHQFFHWHLAFPDAYGGSDSRSAEMAFDVVIGNPPWEQVLFQEREFFAVLAPDIAAISRSAERRKAIARLESEDPSLFARFSEAVRRVRAQNQFLRQSGLYPLTAGGRHLGTAGLFTERARQLSGDSVGLVVPTEVGTGDTTKELFWALISGRELVSFFDFENRRRIFSAVHAQFRFALITFATGEPSRETQFAFFCQTAGDSRDPARRFTMSANEISEINPNTRVCPVFRRERDAQLVLAFHRRFEILKANIGDGCWAIATRPGLFNMALQSGHFRTADEVDDPAVYVPLYEGKMVHQYDHRWENLDGSRVDRSADVRVVPRYWIAVGEVEARANPHRSWHLAVRTITNPTNERTLVSAALPYVGVGHTLTLIESENQDDWMLLAILNSFVVDYIARCKFSGTYLSVATLEQLPVPSPEAAGSDPRFLEGSLGDWLKPRVAELSWTTGDLAGLAATIGLTSGPYRWSCDRRRAIAAEIDAAMFHIYGVARDDVEYILETFPIVRRHDVEAHGSFTTKESILKVYDRMAKALETGEPYRTVLDPPPADSSQQSAGGVSK